MIVVDFEVLGSGLAVQAMVAALNLKLSPGPLASWMITELEPIIKNAVIKNFVSESAPGGSPWAALAPSTIERRLEEGFGEGPIQYRTGELYGFFKSAEGDIAATTIGTSYTYPGQPPQGDNFYKVQSAQVGNARTGAPARPILGLSLQEAEQVMLGLFEYVVGVKT